MVKTLWPGSGEFMQTSEMGRTDSCWPVAREKSLRRCDGSFGATRQGGVSGVPKWRRRGTDRDWKTRRASHRAAFALAKDYHADADRFVLRDDSLGEARRYSSRAAPIDPFPRAKNNQQDAVAVANGLPVADDVVGLVSSGTRAKEGGFGRPLVGSRHVDAALVGELGKLRSGSQRRCFFVASVGHVPVYEREGKPPGMWRAGAAA